MFDFNSFPFKLSGETVAYICPKCKYKFDAPIEAVLEFEQEDEWNGLPISTPPYPYQISFLLWLFMMLNNIYYFYISIYHFPII